MGVILLNPEQIRAAMALLNWENKELAAASGVSESAVFSAKTGLHKTRPQVLEKIKQALEMRGIEFLDFNGLRQRPEGIRVLQGIDGFVEFYEISFSYLSANGGDVRIYGSDASLYSKYRPNPEEHRIRMRELIKRRDDVHVRILCNEGDFNFVATNYAEYRWLPKEYFSPTTFYTFGDYFALISFFHTPAPHIILIRSAIYAEAYHKQFDSAWATAKEPPKKRKAD